MNENEQGQIVLNDILTHPKCLRYYEHKARYGEVLNFRIPESLGVRFTKEGEFIGFIEPEDGVSLCKPIFTREGVSAFDREHLTCEINGCLSV